MPRTHALGKLIAIVLLVGSVVSGATSAASPETTDAIVWPPNGHVFTNRWYDFYDISIDLSEVGDDDTDHRWDVSLRDDSGNWRLLQVIWGTGTVTIPGPGVGPGSYAVRLDPLWLDDTHTVMQEVTVVEDPSVWVGATIDHREPYAHGQAYVRILLEYPPEPRAGDIVRWEVYRRVDECAAQKVFSCPQLDAGTVVPTGGFQWIDLPLPALSDGEFEIVVYRVLEPETDLWEDRFTVLPPPEVTDVAVSPGTFYPRVEDGYRDHARLTWQQNIDAAASVEVLHGETTVRGEELDILAAGNHSWTWDGRDDSGALVAPGTYTMRVHATDPAQNTGVATTAVTVATDTVIRRETIERDGSHTTTRAIVGACSMRRSHGQLTLNCSGGRFAKASYVYRIPRNAFDVRWVLRGRRSCCAPGRVATTGGRTTPTRYRATVKVTKQRSFTVASADLRYKHRVRR